MNVTFGGIIGLIIGLAFGGISGLIFGIVLTDGHWHKKMESIWAKQETKQAPYEIEKGE